MPTCKQVATALASGELDRAGIRRRLAVRFHLMMCRYCRAYARQIRQLGEATRRLMRREATDPAVVERLEKRLVVLCRKASGKEDAGG